jgi:hypothetical protein
MIPADTLRVVHDTVRIVDTVRVLDTVWVAVRESPGMGEQAATWATIVVGVAAVIALAMPMLDRWRERRNVAAVLAEEVNLNAQILTLHVHLRRRDAGWVSADFSLVRLAFDAIASEIGALPPEVAGHVLVTYHCFDRLERLREMFGERSRRLQAAKATSQADVADRERDVISALDAFNVLVDKARAEIAQALPLLRAIAPKREQREVTDAEYAERVAASEAERVARLKRFEEHLQQRTGTSDPM